MKSEDEPISSDEWLIRLVWGPRIKPNRTPIIGPSSFEPRNDETGGISWFRQDCLNSPLDALMVIKETNRDRNALVLVSVQLLLNLNITIIKDPIPEVLGHVLTPEINTVNFRKNKEQFQDLFLLLAHEASAHIIRYPLT